MFWDKKKQFILDEYLTQSNDVLDTDETLMLLVYGKRLTRHVGVETERRKGNHPRLYRSNVIYSP
jgi:hypothetical protein